MTATTWEMVRAVRNDSLVGRGSCSWIDECLDDRELAQFLIDERVETASEAITVARESEGLFLEASLNARWGEDDDPELRRYREFSERCSEKTC